MITGGGQIMICENCGEKCQNKSNFCKKCGTPIYQAEQPESVHSGSVSDAQANFVSPSVKKFPFKIIIPVAAVIIILLVAVSFLFSGKSSNVMLQTNFFDVFYTDNLCYMTFNNEKLKLPLENSNKLSGLKTSMDGSKAATVVYDDEDSEDNGIGTLWYITVKDKIMVSNGVYRDFYMSDDGNTLVYLKDIKKYDRYTSGTLYKYSCSSKKNVWISDDVITDTIALSPDGQSICYVKDFDENTYEFTGYIKNREKSPESFGKNKLCIAISNNAKYIYYAKLDCETDTESLYVKKGNNETKLCRELRDITGFYLNSNYSHAIFNSDYSQVIFNSEGKSYICKNAGDKVKLLNYEIDYFILPENTQFSHKPPCYLDCSVCGVKEFSNIVVRTDNNVFIYINDKNESSIIDNSPKKLIEATEGYTSYNITQVFLSRDGKTIFCCDPENRLFKRNLDGEISEKINLFDNVTNFVVSPDNSKLYFVNTDNELYYVKGSGKPKKLADDVQKSSLCISADGNVAFFLVDYLKGSGTLYYSKNGKNKSRIADDVYDVTTTPVGAFYYSEYDNDNRTYDVYLSSGSVKFELFLNDAYREY